MSMRKLLIILLFPLFLFGATSVIDWEGDEEGIPLSQPEEIEDPFSNESDLIGGILSPLNGLPCIQEIDLVARGAENIILSRRYLASQTPDKYSTDPNWNEYFRCLFLYKHIRGWTFLPHTHLKTVAKKYRFTNPSGTTLDFKIAKENTTLANEPYGISNYSNGLPSGKYDARNTKVELIPSDKNVTVTVADGTKFYYTKTKGKFLLQKEVHPNGKIWRYSYASDKLQKIESLDPKEEFVYASMDIIGAPSSSLCTFSTHSGQIASYHYLLQKLEGKGKTKKHGASHEEKISCTSRPILTKVCSPFHPEDAIEYDPSFLLQNYVSLKNPFKCTHQLCKKKEDDSTSFYKTSKLQMPVGENNGWHDLYEITYDSPIPGEKEGSTTISNSDGTQIIYEFTKNLLLSSKKIYESKGKLRKEKIFTWNTDNTLASIEWTDDDHNPLLVKSYFNYDRFGNPTIESLTGTLTGYPWKDTYSILRTFSQDGLHLILKEIKEEGPTVEYTYLPGTNLLTGQFTKEGARILLREFRSYDEWNNLVQKISDNGSSDVKDNLSGITQRTIVNYHLRKSPPHLHMVDWIEEKYLENGEEVLLKKTQLTYDTESRVVQEDIYDANNSYCYSIHKKYDPRRKLLEETNAIGQKAFYTYDERGNLIESIPFSNRLHKKMCYDLKGRLLEKQEIGEGTVRHFFYKYDPQGRCTHEQDHLNNITEFVYDLIVNKPKITKLPSLLNTHKEISVSTQSIFDPWGRKIEKWDANGNKTMCTYNAYGKPLQITHPDGTIEKSFYSKNGRLIKFIDPEGNVTTHKRDCLGRILLKELKSATGILQASETFEYDAYHLKKWTDKEGNVTYYSYDGAGRKISKEKSGKIIRYTYDPLGRLSSKSILNGENTLKITYTRDLLDRIIEETKEDLARNLYSKTCYAYDAAGNISKEICFIGNQESCTQYTYDAFNRLISKQSPLGALTQIRYEESTPNALGQKVPQKITTNEKNIVTIETFDPFGKLIKKEKFKGHSWLSCQTKRYDPNGNLLEQTDHSTRNESHVLKYTYSSLNQVTESIRAFGTPNERKTSYTHTPSGKIQSITHPNGVTIHYEYSPLGYLEKRTSSDGTIDHSFKHNKTGNLIHCKDTINGVEVTREVDSFGNIISESISTGLYLNKTYDCMDRPLTLVIPHAGLIQYHYNPCNLTKMERRDLKGNCLYSHTFNTYDLSCRLMEESLMHGLGKTVYTYDLEGRITSITNPLFHEDYFYSLEGNLIEKKGKEKSHQYRYDFLNQLITEIRDNDVESYAYDALYARTIRNGQKTRLNELCELLQQNETTLAYDLNGNLIQKDGASFSYDPLNQLTFAKVNGKTITYLYDPLGRCIRRIAGEDVENYLYDGTHEIGAFTAELTPKQFRVLDNAKHFPKTVSIELDSKPYAPITDAQGNIRCLIDPETNFSAESYDFNAFGEPLSNFKSINFNPWRFASKRLDPDLKWVQFGKRYYDPLLARWITTDPAGFTDSVNLYQFLFNNPYRYRDRDGRNAVVIVLFEIVWDASVYFVLPSIEYLLTAATAAAAAVLVYEATQDAEIANAFAEGITPDLIDSEQEEKKKKEEAPYPYPGNKADESSRPGEDWKWRGRDNGKGSWVKENEDGSTESSRFAKPTT